MNLPPFSARQNKLLQEGIELFNREEFFACHEVLEEAWLEVSGDQKMFLQGLIQIAVAFHHLRRGNFVGARRLLAAGKQKLSAFADERQSLDVAVLLTALEPLDQQLQSGELGPDWPAPRMLSQLHL